jgi:hypothetical protein
MPDETVMQPLPKNADSLLKYERALAYMPRSGGDAKSSDNAIDGSGKSIADRDFAFGKPNTN